MKRISLFLVLVLLSVSFIAYGQNDSTYDLTEIDFSAAHEHLEKGEDFFEKEKFAEAIAEFTKAIELDNQYLEAYYLRGLMKFLLTDYIGAITDFTRAIDIAPTYILSADDFIGSAYLFRGYCKQMKQDMHGAISDFTECIEKDNDPEAYYARGLSKITLLKIDAGCLDLSRAGELGLSKAYEAIREFCQ